MCEGSLAVTPPSLPSAILVDEMRRLVVEGLEPAEALVVAADNVRAGRD